MGKRTLAAVAAMAAVSLVVGTAVGTRPAGAAATAGWRSLSYGTEHFAVPSRWPVFDLARTPSTCVRFNRHAVYLGAARAAGRCPASAAGVAAALEVAPLGDFGTLPREDGLRAERLHGQRVLLSGTTALTHRLVAVFPAAGIEATVSYRTAGSLARRILATFRAGRGAALPPTSRRAGPSHHDLHSPAASAGTGTKAEVYRGEGFDTCEAPDEQQMAAWKQYSPYGAIGVYVGGVNAACTNVTASWVADETASGWAVFPIYVGMQAPCADQPGLVSMSDNPATATDQGMESAKNAIADAESYGIGTGTTIYFDMEAWNVDAPSCNAAVLGFITGWTEELHASHYRSGMYGSLGAGISPGIVSLYGTNGAPGVIWFADWDGEATTATTALPAAYWSHHQRIKQYAGNVWQSYGGVSIEVDPDYLDAPTLARVGPTVSAIVPSTAPVGARVQVLGAQFVPDETVVHFGKVAGADVDVVNQNELTVVVPPQLPRRWAVTVTTPEGTSAPDPDPSLTYSPFESITADPSTGVYWMATAGGNVDNFGGTWYGSAAGHRLHAPVVGIARTAKGYLIATAAGNVYNYNTPFYGSMAHKKLPSPIVGIAATSSGYLLVTETGNVYNFHTPWYGSRKGKRLSSPVVGIAATQTGYLLVTSKGNVYGYDTPFYGSEAGKTLASRVVGIAATTTGYLLATAQGSVYNFNTPWWGSKAGSRLPAPISSISATPTGYLLTTTAGQLYRFNTASYGSPAEKG